MRKWISIALAGTLAAAAAACDTNDGPFEEAGERADEAAEDLEEGLDEAFEDLDDNR